MTDYKITKNLEFNSIEVYFNGMPTKEERERMKAAKMRWHGVKKCWYGFISENEFMDLLTGSKDAWETAKANKYKTPELLEFYKKELEKVWNDDKRMIDYCIKETNAIVRLENGKFLTIDKPLLETHFCFGYGHCGVSTEEDYKAASNMERYAATNEEYFFNENTKVFDEIIEGLESGIMWTKSRREGNEVSLLSEKWMNEYRWSKGPEWMEKCHVEKLTETDIKNVLEAYKIEKEKLIKRCRTYLKKYGTSKLHTWTYLSD